MFTKNRKGMGGLKDGVGCDKGFPCSVNAGLMSIEKVITGMSSLGGLMETKGDSCARYYL